MGWFLATIFSLSYTKSEIQIALNSGHIYEFLWSLPQILGILTGIVWAHCVFEKLRFFSLTEQKAYYGTLSYLHNVALFGFLGAYLGMHFDSRPLIALGLIPGVILGHLILLPRAGSRHKKNLRK